MAISTLSSNKTHTLHHTFYEPKGAVKATLLIVHGMSEHSGRYAQLAQFLADNGIAVLAYDQLGHGRTVNRSDELGFFDKQHPVQMLLRDVILMADNIKEKHPDVPHFILGHSMGSFIVRNVLQHHSNEFTGAILMGSSDVNPLSKVLLPITRSLNLIKPKTPNSLFASVLNKVTNQKIKPKSYDSKFAWICKNEEAVKQYEKDPLCGFEFTNNGFLGLFSLMNTGLAKDWAKNIEKDFPMLFISGEEDPIGDMGKGIKKLTKRLNKQGFSHVATILYPNMRHEPINEVNNEEVYADLLNWIEATI